MSRRRVRVGGVAIVALAAVLVAAGFGSSSNQASRSVAGKLRGQITIGAALPITGSSATIGKDQARGVQLAVDQVNGHGGVLGKKLKVVIEDTQSDTVAAVQAAHKLVSVNHVPVVVGEYLSNHTIGMGKYLQQVHVVQINPGSSSPDIAKIGSYSFSSIALDNLAGKLAAEYFYKHGARKIAYFGPNNAYGAGFQSVITSRFKQLGGSVTTSILYTEGQTTYNAELQRMKSSGADVYVYASYQPDDVTINKEAYQLGLDAKKFFGIYLSICVEGVPAQAIAGQQGLDLAYVGPTGAAYLKAYEAKFGGAPPTPYSAYVYDAVRLAAKAINQAKSAAPAKIRAALVKAGRNYPGATGSITFDKHGQRTSAPYTILKVDADGKLVTTSTVTVKAGG